MKYAMMAGHKCDWNENYESYLHLRSRSRDHATRDKCDDKGYKKRQEGWLISGFTPKRWRTGNEVTNDRNDDSYKSPQDIPSRLPLL